MAKKVKEIIKKPPHDERCGDCYYNEEGECTKNPEKCVYNQPPKEIDDEEELE